MNAQDKHAKWLIGQVERGRMSRREFLGRTTALGISMSVGTGMFSAAHAQAPKKGGHMRIASGHGSTSDTLDPAFLENGLQNVANYGVANTLTEINAQGELSPSLATEWETSPDAKVWTFKLRKGVEFHNGKTMTSEDVIASLNYHRGEDSKSVVKPLMQAVAEIKADGPDVVVITLSEGNADFPYNFNQGQLAIYPAKDGGIDWKAGGSGAYILKSEEPGRRYAFERNPNYWNAERGHADTIELFSIADPAARQNALLTNEVDVIDRVELKTLALMARKPGIVVEEGSGPLHYTFPMLSKVVPFDNPDLRKALKYGLNRQDILDKILFGHGVIGNDHPIGPSYRFHAGDIEQISYDPDKAAHHFKKSGVGDITLNLSAADSAYLGAVDAAILYQAAADAAGIKIKVVREPNDGYWSDVWMKKPWCACYWAGYATEDTMFSTGYASGAAWNDTQWDNSRFDELLVQARSETDRALRAEMYRDMQVMLRDDGGAIVPMFANDIQARNEKVAHGDLSWFRSLDGSRIMERWWVV